MESFTVTWDAEKLTHVRARVRDYRFPLAPENAGWRYGCDPAFLRALCDYWLDRFDAQAAARELNRFPQFRTRIEDLDIHFIHLVGEAQGRRPLLLTHGWPGSVYEFWQVIEPLAYPSRFGGDAADAFDLVIPSLPGFGFSGKPRTPIGARTTARLFDTLMRNELGYPRYLAQGGDWGAAVTAWLGLEHAASVRAIHLNYLLVQPDATPQSDEEVRWKVARDEAEQQFGAYRHLQASKPLSLSYAMADDPVAQAAWIVERFHDWADLRARSFAAVFSMDQLLIDIMLYVMTDSFPTATWFYTGAVTEQVRTMPQGLRVAVPTAFTAYPDPRAPRPPRSWVERGYALSRWVDQTRGGHFAAMEVPEVFVADLRSWARATT